MIISVTGATGFIGRRLVQRLHAGMPYALVYWAQLYMFYDMICLFSWYIDMQHFPSALLHI